MYSSEVSEKLRERFDCLAQSIVTWKKKNRYYYDDMYRYFQFLVPENLSILMLGSGTGDLLAALNPSRGLGIDISPKIVGLAKKRHPHLEFRVGDADNLEELHETFDVIVMTDIIGHLQDIEEKLRGLHRFCHKNTRLIICYFNFLWEPVIRFAQKLHLAMPQGLKNWLSANDIEGLLHLADFELIKEERRLLLPKRIPLLSTLVNRYIAPLPGIRRLCLSEFFVARPLPLSMEEVFSTTILIPCRNERGNIETAIRRLPKFGKHQEIIFVEGHSTDGTLEEIKRVAAAHPEKDIKVLVQDGRGKGDAVHKGFSLAKGDILMILDADLTVPPEDLPKFYRALATGKGEFVNGCRLVYPMEDQAMRFLNLLGNKFFSLAFTWLLNQRFKDTLCGTKALFKKDYIRLTAGKSYFGDFDPFGDFDLIFGASKLNLKIVEIPIRYHERAYGTTQISRFKHGILLLKMTIFAFKKLKAL